MTATHTASNIDDFASTKLSTGSNDEGSKISQQAEVLDCTNRAENGIRESGLPPDDQIGGSTCGSTESVLVVKSIARELDAPLKAESTESGTDLIACATSDDSQLSRNTKVLAQTCPKLPTLRSMESKKHCAPTTPGILSLPIDSLHCIASFLSAREWCNGFGLVSKASANAAREIVRRVRLHGFKCATEVVTALKLGQIADAKELAALYVSYGVPLYAKCLGHSYHTLHWRIQVEHRELQNVYNNQTRHVNSDSTSLLSEEFDPFYSRRSEFRNREGYGRDTTYLEEKCLFWSERFAQLQLSDAPLLQRSSDTRPSPNLRHNRSLSAPLLDHQDFDFPKLSRKFPLPIHQHLLDRHEAGDAHVNDFDGKMGTPQVSLSADFFHPVSRSFRKVKCSRTLQTDSIFVDSMGCRPDACHGLSSEVGVSNAVVDSENDITDVFESVSTILNPATDRTSEAVTDNRLQDSLVPMQEIDNRDLVAEPIEDGPIYPRQISFLPRLRIRSALFAMETEVYSSSMTQDCLSSSKLHNPQAFVLSQRDIMKHLRSRFATYQRRLEALLSQGGSRVYGFFEECLLDFWDEFLPHTADIHYHDTETAVPRISCLQKFLTKPCPQAIGVIQCEIERIRISSRGKGVNMKGRLFPTYEYRLFIRNRPPFLVLENSTGHDGLPDEFVRRDTLLMVAKNRGRKHCEGSGVVSSSKKGSNNYYLYMPKQMDVDDHFNMVNSKESSYHSEKPPARLQPNGVSNDPVLTSDDAGSVLLGRLQSNFIGTEFQIFTPRLRKVVQPHLRLHNVLQGLQKHQPCSEDELDYDSGVSSDTNNNPASSKKSRFGRLALRRAQQSSMPRASSPELPTCSAMSDSSSPYASDRQRPVVRSTLKRTFSSPDLSSQGRQSRTNRRAIANSNDANQLSSTSIVLSEEENGVITYTANLLGSRPRIMDVCIPKVTDDGLVGFEWKRHLQTIVDMASEQNDSSRMLGCFRQLQQRRDHNDNLLTAAPFVNDANQAENLEREQEMTELDGIPRSPDDFGLMVLQNRPPWWNVELGSFVLNFGGRVSVASVKNFQLCERTDQDRILLQFGRIQGRHSFTMDFQHPLTAVQAFSIAISSLQSKISFG